jgi:hypothetical protein
MSSLNPDREMLARFAGLMFKHARPDAFVSLRLRDDFHLGGHPFPSDYVVVVRSERDCAPPGETS